MNFFKETKEYGTVPLNKAARPLGDDKSESSTLGGYRSGIPFVSGLNTSNGDISCKLCINCGATISV